jgi:hypothetical protein
MTIFRFMPCRTKKPSKEIGGPAWIELLSMLHIGVVDSNHQGLGRLGQSDTLPVRNVKSLGLKFSAYSQRVTANRHVTRTHISETADLEDPGCRAIRNASLLDRPESGPLRQA